MNSVTLICQQTMIFMVPLLLVALGGMISEKSGITNVGLEGMMIIGALGGIGYIHFFQEKASGQLFFLAAIMVAGITGGLYALIHAWASVSIHADQTVSGTALNLFAPAFAVFIAQSTIGERKIRFIDSFSISEIPVLSRIPFLGPVLFSNCYVTTLICLIAFLLITFILNKTSVGLRLGACGEKPQAVASVGISVKRYRYAAVFVSGLLSGVGGMAFVIPTSTYFNGSVSGYGFLALSLVIFGRWKPVSILGGAILFGFLKAVSCIYGSIQFLSDLSIPPEIYRMMPFVITLVVLALSSDRSSSPKALGVPFYEEGE